MQRRVHNEGIDAELSRGMRVAKFPNGWQAVGFVGVTPCWELSMVSPEPRTSSRPGRRATMTTTLPHREAWWKDYNGAGRRSSPGGLTPYEFAGSKAGLRVALV